MSYVFLRMVLTSKVSDNTQINVPSSYITSSLEDRDAESQGVSTIPWLERQTLEFEKYNIEKS